MGDGGGGTHTKAGLAPHKPQLPEDIHKDAGFNLYDEYFSLFELVAYLGGGLWAMSHLA